MSLIPWSSIPCSGNNPIHRAAVNKQQPCPMCGLYSDAELDDFMQFYEAEADDWDRYE